MKTVKLQIEDIKNTKMYEKLVNLWEEFVIPPNF